MMLSQKMKIHRLSTAAESGSGNDCRKIREITDPESGLLYLG